MTDSNFGARHTSQVAASAWLNYRRSRRNNFTLLLAGLPVACVLIIVFGSARLSAQLLAVFFVVWIAALTTSGIRTVAFRCPRCRQLFFVKNAFFMHWARNCRHCGLPKWAEVVDDAQTGRQQPRSVGADDDHGASLVVSPAGSDPVAETARALFATGFLFAISTLGLIAGSITIRAILHSEAAVDPAAAELAQGILDNSLVHGPGIIAASGLLLIAGIAVMQRRSWCSWFSRLAVAGIFIVVTYYLVDSQVMLRDHDHRAHQGPWARAGERMDNRIQKFGALAMMVPLLGGASWLWRRIGRVERDIARERNKDTQPFG